MERLGMGGRKLAEECRALKAKPPVWKAEKGLVSLTLFRAPNIEVLSEVTPRQQEFLRSLTEGHSFKALITPLLLASVRDRRVAISPS
jgi:hypothetical protein